MQTAREPSILTPMTDIPPARIRLYEQLVATHQGDFKVKGAKSRYTSLNGHMFSFLTPEGKLALRFSKEDQEAFMKEHRGKVCIQYGAVMRGYALVPDTMFKKTAEMKKFFAKSVAYIKSLEPNPTTRKKKATKKKAAKKKAAKKKAAKKKTTKKR